VFAFLPRTYAVPIIVATTPPFAPSLQGTARDEARASAVADHASFLENQVSGFLVVLLCCCVCWLLLCVCVVRVCVGVVYCIHSFFLLEMSGF